MSQAVVAILTNFSLCSEAIWIRLAREPLNCLPHLLIVMTGGCCICICSTIYVATSRLSESPVNYIRRNLEKSEWKRSNGT